VSLSSLPSISTARSTASLTADAAALPPRAERFGRALLGSLLPLCFLALWALASRQGWIGRDLLPSPGDVLRTTETLVLSGALFHHLAATLARMLAGFLIGAAAASLLGALAGSSVLVHASLDPLIQGLRSVPSIAWVPLFVLWFGIFEASKIALIAAGVFFPVYLNLASALARTDSRWDELAATCERGRMARFFLIALPASLPAYITGLRSGLGLGWMFVAAAELMGASQGLGFLLTDGEQTGRPETVLTAIVIFALCGRASDRALAALAARLAWR